MTFDPVTQIIIETFRLNGDLIAAGDALVADVGLTSARWQVLGALMTAGCALTVSQTARNMGLSRQAVQRLANDMTRDGLLAPRRNPDHARAPLFTITAKGQAAYEAAMQRQRPWAQGLREGLSDSDILSALRILRHLRARIIPHDPSKDAQP